MVTQRPPRGPHALFLDELDPATREKVVARAIRRHFDAGTTIVHEGDPGAGLFVTVQGLVKVYKTSINGREQVLRYAPPGSSFNEVTVLDGGTNPTSASAVAPTDVLVISKALMTQLLDEDPTVARAVIESLTGLYRHLMQMVEELSFLHVSERVARVLLQSVMPGPGLGAGADMQRRLTQTEIAQMIGSTREVVGRALRTLEDSGAITIERGLIVLKDPSKIAS